MKIKVENSGITRKDGKSRGAEQRKEEGSRVDNNRWLPVHFIGRGKWSIAVCSVGLEGMSRIFLFCFELI